MDENAGQTRGQRQLTDGGRRPSSGALPATAGRSPHVGAFAGMMCGRHGDRLDAWLAAVEADTLIPLNRFAAGLRRDYDAVRAGPLGRETAWPR